jgi:hypothetical protein
MSITAMLSITKYRARRYAEGNSPILDVLSWNKKHPRVQDEQATSYRELVDIVLEQVRQHSLQSGIGEQISLIKGFEH